MGLRIGRRDAHGIAGVNLGFGEIALAQQQQRQLVGGPEIIRIETDDAPDQRFGRSLAVLVFPDLVEHGQRAGPVRREFQHLQAKLFRGVDRALAMGLHRGRKSTSAAPGAVPIPARCARSEIEGRNIATAAGRCRIRYATGDPPLPGSRSLRYNRGDSLSS